MKNNLAVLIVGAGPTGLMMGCELQRHNISFRIIDEKEEPTKGSNANWIQSRTLEIFDFMGIAERFIKIGNKCEAINIYLKGQPITNIAINKINSVYPFVLMLPQSETERLLNDRLNEFDIRVEKSSKFLNFQQTSEGMVSTIRHANGDTEDITSNWVIACDGANSSIREKCHLSFSGKDIPEQFMVADAKMSSFLPTNEIHIFFDKGTIFPEKRTLFTAFPQAVREYRISANLYQDSPRKFFTSQEVKEVVAERTYGNFIVDSVSWISPFWIHSKIVDQMHQGAIFLAGDAAHIHSPVGGQGMNAGIQDAFNLAWKLALVIKNKATKSLLNTYQEERFPIVNNIVNQTDFFTNIFLFDKSFSRKLKKFSVDISEHPFLSKQIAEELTQISLRYKNSSIINYDENPKLSSPLQGERAPDVILNNSMRLYDSFSKFSHNIIIFTGKTLSRKELDVIEQLQDSIENKHSEAIKLLVITQTPLNKINNYILDSNYLVHNRYNVNHLCLYMVRPDNCIAYYSSKITLASIEKFLEHYQNKLAKLEAKNQKVVTMTDKELAKLDPSSVYKNPHELFTDKTLTNEERIDILQRWAYDENEMSVAEEENMKDYTNEKKNTLDEIHKFLLKLGVDSTKMNHPPTKHG